MRFHEMVARGWSKMHFLLLLQLTVIVLFEAKMRNSNIIPGIDHSDTTARGLSESVFLLTFYLPAALLDWSCYIRGSVKALQLM